MVFLPPRTSSSVGGVVLGSAAVGSHHGEPSEWSNSDDDYVSVLDDAVVADHDSYRVPDGAPLV